MHDATTLVVVEQMFAPRRRPAQDMAVDEGGIAEPALGAGDSYRGTAETLLMQPRKTVQSVALRHVCSPGPYCAPGTGGAT